MNERLTLQDLIDLLAKKQGITKKDAEIFLRELFTVITENIENNEPVKIKDFGTFKLVKVNARKSVNVNTGEAIEIAAHYKLSFTPDKLLKEAVNRPFAHFESVVLEDGVTFENVAVNESAIVDSDEDFDSETDEISTNEEEILIEAEQDTPINKQEPEQTPLTPHSLITEEQEPVKETVNEDNLDLSHTEIIQVEPEIIGEDLEDEDVTIEESMKEENIEKPNQEEEADLQPEQQEISSVEEIETPTQPVVNTVSYEEEEDDDYLYEEESSGFNKKWTVVIMLIIAALAFAAGYFYYCCRNGEATIIPCNDASKQDNKTVVDTLASDSATVKAPIDSTIVDQQAVDTSKEQPIEKPKEEAKKPVGKSKVTAVKYGQTLRMMGLEQYGNKSFWVYIYQENKAKIKNPNNVPVGTELTIAPREKYGIDPSSSASVKKAKELEKKLFKELE